MKRYDERMLHLLLDKYEHSLLYTEENKRNQSIAVPVNRKTMPEYFDETSVEYDHIHSQLLEMEEKGYIRLVWKRGKVGHMLEKCVLITEQAPQIYSMLKRTSRHDKKEQMLEICRSYYRQGEILDRFLHWCRMRLDRGEGLQGYASIEEPERFRETCYLMQKIENNQDEIFLREFSIRYFHDSKAAEKSIGHAAIVLRDFALETDTGTEKNIPDITETDQPQNKNIQREDPEAQTQSKTERIGRLLTSEMTAQDVLEEFHIYKNPSWILVKGCGRFTVSAKQNENHAEHYVDLRTIPGGVGISSEDISSLSWDPHVKPGRVITIENLTSFHRWNDPQSLAIYLGGYHNGIKCAFLQRMAQTWETSSAKCSQKASSVNGSQTGEVLAANYTQTPEATAYLHFGDIDAGGFKIWKNLCQKTGIAFRPYCMDEETYRSYLEFGRELTKNDCAELSRMQQDPFFADQVPLFARMLEQNRKLEQECIIRL